MAYTMRAGRYYLTSGVYTRHSTQVENVNIAGDRENTNLVVLLMAQQGAMSPIR